MIKLEFFVPDSRGLGQEAMDLWRPHIAKWIEGNVQRLALDVRSKLSRPGLSAPGQPPGRQSGEYQGSWSYEMKEYKRSTHGRVGSSLWGRFGAALELGSERLRPRPHVSSAIARWMREVKRQIEENNRG